MLVEGLGNVTFVNGVLRIETLMVKGDGKIGSSGSIEIPGNMVGEIINGLVKTTQGISEKINEESSESEKATQEKSSSKSKKKKK
tara:strand:+ start:224 stop:478 length:255 start_codon:yes stop_codon:yes gene_type:complete